MFVAVCTTASSLFLLQRLPLQAAACVCAFYAATIRPYPWYQLLMLYPAPATIPLTSFYLCGVAAVLVQRALW